MNGWETKRLAAGGHFAQAMVAGIDEDNVVVTVTEYGNPEWTCEGCLGGKAPVAGEPVRTGPGEGRNPSVGVHHADSMVRRVSNVEALATAIIVDKNTA